MIRKIENAIYAIKTNLTGYYDTVIEVSNDLDLYKYIAERESKGAKVISVKQFMTYATPRIGFRSDPYFKNWKKGYELISVIKKFNFRFSTTSEQIYIFYDDAYGHTETLFSYDVLKNKLNYECKYKHFCWLSKTRSDLTVDKLVAFISEINEALKLRGENKLTLSKLIAPEDWQEIAKVDDAFKDQRYIGG